MRANAASTSVKLSDGRRRGVLSGEVAGDAQGRPANTSTTLSQFSREVRGGTRFRRRRTLSYQRSGPRALTRQPATRAIWPIASG